MERQLGVVFYFGRRDGGRSDRLCQGFEVAADLPRGEDSTTREHVEHCPLQHQKSGAVRIRRLITADLCVRERDGEGKRGGGGDGKGGGRGGEGGVRRSGGEEGGREA